jgi:hypothetical protein
MKRKERSSKSVKKGKREKDSRANYMQQERQVGVHGRSLYERKK